MLLLNFLAWSLGIEAVYQGFNYGSTFSDGSAKQQSDFEAEFNRARNLQGTSGFTSARLYTMIQGGTSDTPTSAIQAAITSQTTLLLGLWASAGQAGLNNEITALTSAINGYGTAFTSLIAGISVGSEDLYRVSPTGVENHSGAGASPTDIVSYINQVRSAISGTVASGLSVGHVDTWTAWVNGSNDVVIKACDWLGMDAYPYYQTTINNSIDVAKSTFFNAYDATVAVSRGKPVWITETGWPVSGPEEHIAVASVPNAESYWQDVACTVLGITNTWWYILQDALPTTPSPSFGVVGADLYSAPLYNLTCNTVYGTSSALMSTSETKSASSVASLIEPASSVGTITISVSQATLSQHSLSSSFGPVQRTTSSVTQSVDGVGASRTANQIDPGMKSTSQPSLATVTSCSGTCSNASGTSAAMSSSTSSNVPSASPSASNCPTNLDGEYQYPHLIIPVDSANPTKAYGTSYNGTITSTISSIFNFDLPASYAGRSCSLVFLFPTQAALRTSSFTLNGQGGITVNELSAPATEQTTYDTLPGAAVVGVGNIPNLQRGNSYLIASYECNAGTRQAFEFSASGNLSLVYFQDSVESPVGAFITVC